MGLIIAFICVFIFGVLVGAFFMWACTDASNDPRRKFKNPFPVTKLGKWLKDRHLRPCPMYDGIIQHYHGGGGTGCPGCCGGVASKYKHTGAGGYTPDDELDPTDPPKGDSGVDYMDTYKSPARVQEKPSKYAQQGRPEPDPDLSCHIGDESKNE